MKNNLQYDTSEARIFSAGPKLIQFMAEVEFGTPSTNCQNYGICRLDIAQADRMTEVQDPNCCRSYLAHISYTNVQQLTIRIAKQQLNEKIIQKYFSDSAFLVEEDFKTSVQIDKTMQQQVLQINKGNYSITKTTKDYIIHFF